MTSDKYPTPPPRIQKIGVHFSMKPSCFKVRKTIYARVKRACRCGVVPVLEDFPARLATLRTKKSRPETKLFLGSANFPTGCFIATVRKIVGLNVILNALAAKSSALSRFLNC